VLLVLWLVALTIEGYEPFLVVPSLFSTMILGAVPLVYFAGTKCCYLHFNMLCCHTGGINTFFVVSKSVGSLYL
jgi:hypothetical protein